MIFIQDVPNQEEVTETSIWTALAPLVRRPVLVVALDVNAMKAPFKSRDVAITFRISSTAERGGWERGRKGGGE